VNAEPIERDGFVRASELYDAEASEPTAAYRLRWGWSA
jgi:hypothetical protein